MTTNKTAQPNAASALLFHQYTIITLLNVKGFIIFKYLLNIRRNLFPVFRVY